MRPYILGAIILLFAVSCAAFKKDARTVLDVTEQACILAQPIQSTPTEVVAACGVVEALYPVLNDLLTAKRAAMVTMAIERGANR